MNDCRPSPRAGSPSADFRQCLSHVLKIRQVNVARYSGFWEQMLDVILCNWHYTFSIEFLHAFIFGCAIWQDWQSQALLLKTVRWCLRCCGGEMHWALHSFVLWSLISFFNLFIFSFLKLVESRQEVIRGVPGQDSKSYRSLMVLESLYFSNLTLHSFYGSFRPDSFTSFSFSWFGYLDCWHLMAVKLRRDRLRRIILLLEANYATLADCPEKALFVLCDQEFKESLSQQQSRFRCGHSTSFHMYRCKMQGYGPKIPNKHVFKLKVNFVVFLMASCNQKSPSFRLGVLDLSRSVKIGIGWDGIQLRNANRRMHVGDGNGPASPGVVIGCTRFPFIGPRPGSCSSSWTRHRCFCCLMPKGS